MHHSKHATYLGADKRRLDAAVADGLRGQGPQQRLARVRRLAQLLEPLPVPLLEGCVFRWVE